jgi:hypothetical protein
MCCCGDVAMAHQYTASNEVKKQITRFCPVDLTAAPKTTTTPKTATTPNESSLLMFQRGRGLRAGERRLSSLLLQSFTSFPHARVFARTRTNSAGGK